jgi:microcystin-dependent protein
MPIDFPSSPTNGQVSGNYYYDATTGAWRSFSSTVNPIPSTLKNLTVSSSETTGVSLKVTPFTTSSVNLQEWYNTSSNIVASMNVAGDLTVNSITLTTDLSVANGGTGASSFTSGAYIKGAGTGALTAQVGIPGSDISSGQVSSSFGGAPTGGIMPFAGAAAPSGWLLCEGQELAISSFTALYNVLTATGTVFPYGTNTNGSGAAGTTHFRLPDLRGDVPVGKTASGTFATLGSSGGVESVTLTAAQSGVPAHSHPNTLSDPGHSHVIRGPVWRESGFNVTMRTDGGAGQSVDQGARTNTDYTGMTISNANNVAANASQAHTNLQPYIVLNYIIKT